MRFIAGLLMALVAAAAIAQTNVRVRGTITALKGDVLMVKSREGRDIALNLAPDTQVVTAKKVSADDLPALIKALKDAGVEVKTP